jgi:hypothetical protein
MGATAKSFPEAPVKCVFQDAQMIQRTVISCALLTEGMDWKCSPHLDLLEYPLKSSARDEFRKLLVALKI